LKKDDCLIVEFVKDSGALPVVFSSASSKREHCCKTIESNAGREELQIALLEK